MLSVVIDRSLQKVGRSSVHLLQINCLVYGDWAFEVTLHSSSARLNGIYPVQIHLIGIRNSPDHYSVRNKEVKFILNLWGQDLVSIVWIRESPYYSVPFF